MSDTQFSVPIWDGTANPIAPGSGSTPFGYYDSDSDFQFDAPRVAKWCAIRLGYPIVDIELQSGSFYACFEESISEYSNMVNNFLMQQHMIDLVGLPTTTNISNKDIKSGFQRVITIAKNYANEAFVMGNQNYYSGSIDVSADQQIYDLDVLFPSASASGGLEIKRIYHQEPSAIMRYFDPYAGSGVGSQYMLQEFGWGSYSPGINFVMMPIYEDLLRLQAIEFNTQIRRSSYSFDVHDNKIRIFPRPTSNYKIWIEYSTVADAQNSQVGTSDVMSSPSDIPYSRHTYANINHSGKTWIKEYTLALIKEVLGLIRSKYQSIPIPGGETSLDGETLRNEGITRKTELLESLRADFEKMSKSTQWEQKQKENEVAIELLKNIPTKIYIG